jgi:hypothetical protein
MGVVCPQANFGFYWYAINVEDQKLNQPSLLERLKLVHTAIAARDRCVCAGPVSCPEAGAVVGQPGA